MLDIDRFKDYNDRYGHPAGDELLKQAANARRMSTRDRLRGSLRRFALLLPKLPTRRWLRRHRADTGRHPHAATVSAGIAEWDGEESAEALIQRVDAALYQAKRAGRDRSAVG